MSRLLSLVALVGAAILATGCGGGEEDKTIPVAIVGPITGQYASFGAQMKSGGEMAVADINEAGGVLGQKLDLATGDAACDPKRPASTARALSALRATMLAIRSRRSPSPTR